MANNELLDLTLNHIIENPESWHQQDWRCGTSYCFFGHAALLSGWKSAEGDTSAFMVSPDNEVDTIENVARRALDLDDETAGILSCATNTLDDLKWMVEEIKRNGGLRKSHSECHGWDGCCCDVRDGNE